MALDAPGHHQDRGHDTQQHEPGHADPVASSVVQVEHGGDWRSEIGDEELEISDWRFQIGDFRLEIEDLSSAIWCSNRYLLIS